MTFFEPGERVRLARQYTLSEGRRVLKSDEASRVKIGDVGVVVDVYDSEAYVLWDAHDIGKRRIDTTCLDPEVVLTEEDVGKAIESIKKSFTGTKTTIDVWILEEMTPYEDSSILDVYSNIEAAKRSLPEVKEWYPVPFDPGSLCSQPGLASHDSHSYYYISRHVVRT